MQDLICYILQKFTARYSWFCVLFAILEHLFDILPMRSPARTLFRKQEKGAAKAAPVLSHKHFSVYRCRAAARMQYRLRSSLIKTGGVYLGFYTLRERKVSA